MTLPLSMAAGRRPARWLPVVLWIALSIAIVVAARHLPWTRAFGLLARIHPGWLAIAIGANFTILPLWAVEWRILAPVTARVVFRRMWDVVTISAAVLNTVPFLAGEATAVALLVERAGLTRGAAMSVLALDQLLVAFAKLLVISTAAVVAPLPEWLRAGVLSLSVAFVALLSLLTMLAHGWSALRERLTAAPGKARALVARVVTWGMHLEALREPKRALLVMALAVMKKAAELAAIIAIQVAFGLEPSVTAGILVLAALAITTLLPVAPANLGVYEATVYATYRYVGMPPDAALGLALVQHLCFLLPPIVVGYAMLTWRQLAPRSRVS